MELGFCGLGRMGTAMVHRLLDLGHRVTVWNRTAAKAEPLVARGARRAATPAEVVDGAELILTILTDDAAVETVYAGACGLLSGPVSGGLFIEMSTLRPDTVRRLSRQVRDRGAALVECPVGGTVGPAREGKLLGFAGGEPADIGRARPVLEQLCRHVEHVGPNGAGSSVKLAVNLPLVVYWEALGEAVSLCSDAGVDPGLLLGIMKESSGGPNVLRNRAPKVLAAIRGDADTDVGFDIDGMRKDLRTMLAVAGMRGSELPVVARALECYDEAAAAGWGDRDASSLVAYRIMRAKAGERESS